MQDNLKAKRPHVVVVVVVVFRFQKFAVMRCVLQRFYFVMLEKFRVDE